MYVWQRAPEKEKGILVACDQEQEWLLEWWWERYCAENFFPVTFVDLGMTEAAQQWCSTHGERISPSLDASFVKPKEDISLELAQQWEGFYGPTLWTARPHWFKKPFVCLHSPYQKTLWMDLDCEILRPIGDLFVHCNSDAPLALVREYKTEHLPYLNEDVRYNGGVILFWHGCPIISHWANNAMLRNADFWSDDALLSALIYELQHPVIELSLLYNWRLAQGIDVNAIIHHWVGSAGKAYIKKHGGIKNALRALHKYL